MPRRQCTYSGCNKIVEVPDGFRDSPRCELHSRKTTPVTRDYSHHYLDGKNVYKSYQWKKLREQFVALNPLCKHCDNYGIVTAGKIVDHIIEIEDGGNWFDINNLQHLCQSCHNAKTAREAMKRKRKAKSTGFKTLSDF